MDNANDVNLQHLMRRIAALEAEVMQLKKQNADLLKDSIPADERELIHKNIDLIYKNMELLHSANDRNWEFLMLHEEKFKARDSELGDVAGRANAAFYTTFPKQAEFEEEVDQALKPKPEDKK